MARRAPKERFIPAGSKPMTRKNIDAVVYVDAKNLTAIAYHGKSKVKDFYIRFPKKEQMDNYIKDYFERRKKADAEAAAYRASKVKPNELVVGDILYDCWGWEQTNIDFYQVAEVKGSFVILRRLDQETTESSPLAMSGHTMPIKDSFHTDPHYSEPLRRKVIHGNAVKINSYGYCQKWDGQPKSCSWYA